MTFLEKNEDKQWLVLKPLGEKEWREEIEDSVVQIGPIARNDVISFCTDRQQHWYDIISRKMRSLKIPDEFKPFTQRPAVEIANVAPGIVPLTIESSFRGSRSYVLGEIAGRLHYCETRLLPDTFIPEQPRTLPSRAFVDADENGSLLINAATKVVVLTAEGERNYPCAVKLKASMPGTVRAGDIAGFPEGSSTPVLWHGEEPQPLGADFEDCNENSVMGWMAHMSGISLLLRRNRKLTILSWGEVTRSQRRAGAHGA